MVHAIQHSLGFNYLTHIMTFKQTPFFHKHINQQAS